MVKTIKSGLIIIFVFVCFSGCISALVMEEYFSPTAEKGDTIRGKFRYDFDPIDGAVTHIVFKNNGSQITISADKIDETLISWGPCLPIIPGFLVRWMFPKHKDYSYRLKLIIVFDNIENTVELKPETIPIVLDEGKVLFPYRINKFKGGLHPYNAYYKTSNPNKYMRFHAYYKTKAANVNSFDLNIDGVFIGKIPLTLPTIKFNRKKRLALGA